MEKVRRGDDTLMVGVEFSLTFLDMTLLQEALDEICNTLGDTPSAAEIRALWNEYEAASTEEAKIVKVRALPLLQLHHCPSPTANPVTLLLLLAPCRTLTSSR
jgi:hypothetical protein